MPKQHRIPPPPSPPPPLSTSLPSASSVPLVCQNSFPYIIAFEHHELPLKWGRRCHYGHFMDEEMETTKVLLNLELQSHVPAPLPQEDTISCLSQKASFPCILKNHFKKIITKMFRHFSAAHHTSGFPVTICLDPISQFLHLSNQILLER